MKQSPIARIALLFPAALLAPSCTITADPVDLPEVVTDPTEAWSGRLDGVLAEGDLDPKLLAEWWTSFEDPTLTALVERALTENLDLRAATSQLRQARAQRRAAGAAGAPQVGVFGAGTRAGQSENSSFGGTNDLFTAGIDASWELDVFGAIDQTVAAADQDVETAREVRRDVLVSIAAEVALNYIDLRALESRLGFLRGNLDIQERTLDIVRKQVELGAAAPVESKRAETQVAATRSQIPLFEQQIAQSKNRLAVLLGQPPGALEQTLAGGEPVQEPDIRLAVGVPAEVLRRRPDVRAAERRLAAESARLGARKADLYPRFSLSGSIGLESLSLPGLFESASRMFSLGPRVQWSPFNGGALRAQVDVQREVQEQTLIGYEGAVLGALEESQNAITAYAQEHLRLQSLREAAEAAAETERIERTRFDLGETNFLSVLDAQRTLLDAQDAAADSASVVVQNLVRVYKALGGGWDPEAPDDVEDAAGENG